MAGSKYVGRFLSLRCSGDVLNATGKLGRYAEKEITEAMAVLRVIKPITLSRPMHYKLIDLCSGNCLIPILAVHWLPIKEATAIDIRPAKKDYSMVKRFNYGQADIYDDSVFYNLNVYPPYFEGEYIVTSCHACKGLAQRVIEIYNLQRSFKHLAIMPCCVGSHSKLPEVFQKRMGNYLEWCLHLYNMIEISKKGAIEDNNCLSPCNYIIKASKEV